MSAVRAACLEDNMRKENSGVIQNSTLLHLINDTVGKEVLVETTDGNRFTGVFAGCSPDTMDIGLLYAYKINSDNEKNLLPRRSEVQEKIQFRCEDVVCWSVVMAEDKTRGFATDRDYHEKNGLYSEDGELEHWVCDEGEEGYDIETDPAPVVQSARSRGYSRNGGWGVNDMFNANSELGVTSTYKDNLSQYTNAEVVDDPELRERAERIAKEIEMNSESKRYAMLENDDEERDLDKLTNDDDFEVARRRGAGRGRGAPMTNKRAEGLRGAHCARGLSGTGRFVNNNNTYNSPNGKPEWRESARPSKDKGYDPQPARKLAVDGRGSSSNSPRSSASDARESVPSTRRGDDLREWRKDFNIVTKDTNEEAKATEVPCAPRSTGNAWTKGPPTSLLTSNSNPSVSPSGASQSLASTAAAEPSEPLPIREANEMKEEEQKEERNQDTAHQEDCVTNSADDSMLKPPGDPKPNDPANSVKDFQFNLNAPTFVPKARQPEPTPSAPISAAGVPITAVPVQAVPPPVILPQQPVVIPYPATQMYQATPQQFQYQMAVRPQPAAQQVSAMMGTTAQARRAPPQQQVYVTAQYPQQVYQTQTPVPMQSTAYFAGGYAPPSVPPPQQYIQQMQMQGGGQPVVSLGYMQGRYVSVSNQSPQQAAAMYANAMPQTSGAGAAPRYPTPQHGPLGHDSYQQGGSQSAGPQAGSQPPTPGPQQSAGVPSPAQSAPLPASPAPTRPFASASPHPSSAPTHHQQPQFIIASAQAPLYYGNQMMYYQSQVPMQASGAHAPNVPGDGHQEQIQMQQQQYEQYGQQYIPTQQPGAYYPQQPPPSHVRQVSLPPQQSYGVSQLQGIGQQNAGGQSNSPQGVTGPSQ